MLEALRLASVVAQALGLAAAKNSLKLLLDEEQIIRQGVISRIENKYLYIVVPGELQLTNMRLRFLSSASDYISYMLRDVVSVTPDRYLWAPGLLFEYSDGRKELFTLLKREQWLKSILSAKAEVSTIGEPERVFDGTILDTDSIAIRQRLSRYFSQDEFRTLCFDLGVDYDNLAGVTKDEKARELVVRLDRDGKLAQLLKRGKELRPNVVWY